MHVWLADQNWKIQIIILLCLQSLGYWTLSSFISSALKGLISSPAVRVGKPCTEDVERKELWRLKDALQDTLSATPTKKKLKTCILTTKTKKGKRKTDLFGISYRSDFNIHTFSQMDNAIKRHIPKSIYKIICKECAAEYIG